MRIRAPWAARVTAFLGAVFIKIISLTYRWKYDGLDRFERIHSDGGVILPFWHNRIIGGCTAPPFRPLDTVVIVSRHFDGEIIARIMAYFGHRSVRGSTGKEGVRALGELAEDVKKGCVVGITPDGPRGPRYRAEAGVAILARYTERPVLPFITVARNRWKVPSWDALEIPKPFSEVILIFGKELRYAGDVPRLRAEVEEEMRSLVESGEAIYGRLPDFREA